jgi:hypothetical protein
MFWLAGSGNGGSPVWVTVLTARFIGGFAAAYATFAMVQSVFTGGLAAGGSTSQLTLELLLAPALVGSLVTGLAITMLLPGMSSRTVGLGNAILAAASGAMVPVIAGLLVAGGLESSITASSIVVVAGASPIISLLATIGSVAVTAWMVETSSAAGGMKWRGRTAPADPTWTDIEVMDTHAAGDDQSQAERGYWGGLYGSDDRAGDGDADERT